MNLIGLRSNRKRAKDDDQPGEKDNEDKPPRCLGSGTGNFHTQRVMRGDDIYWTTDDIGPAVGSAL